MKLKDALEILNLEIPFTKTEVDYQFSKKVKKYHPDLVDNKELEYSLLIQAKKLLSSYCEEKTPNIPNSSNYVDLPNEINEVFETSQKTIDMSAFEKHRNNLFYNDTISQTVMKPRIRETIIVDDFIESQDDFNSVFEYNSEKYGTSDAILPGFGFDQFGNNNYQEIYVEKGDTLVEIKPEYSDIFQTPDVKFENKKSSKKSNLISTEKRLKEIQKDREIRLEVNYHGVEELERQQLLEVQLEKSKKQKQFLDIKKYLRLN